MAGLAATVVDQLLREGVAAMQRRDATLARARFATVTTGAPEIGPAWLLLAQACHLAGDGPAEDAALVRLLAIDPVHVRGLIMTGDRKRALADPRAATAFYQKAVTEAGRMSGLPPALAADVARVQAVLDAQADDYASHIDRTLAAAGLDRVGGRVGEALALATGRATHYPQQPTSFFVPGLPTRPFYDKPAFDWVPAIEAATDAIRTELRSVMDADGAFPPYLAVDPGRPQRAHSLLGKADWGAFHFYRDGAPIVDNAARCPATMAALSQVPLPQIRGRSPMALFSRLEPGTHIPPHNGMLNSRLICHLPLIVPPGCRMRVGNAVHHWREGEMLIFDDSIEHEAWNDSGQTRVILLFEVWHPDLDAAERAALTTVYEAVGAFAAS
jgi:aspartyl/asparaginyl beta-hydroxylase (cupin superfamily)